MQRSIRRTTLPMRIHRYSIETGRPIGIIIDWNSIIRMVRMMMMILIMDVIEIGLIF